MTGFAKLAWPLNELNRFNVPFRWIDAYEKNFQELKYTLTSILVLILLIDDDEFNLYKTFPIMVLELY